MNKTYALVWNQAQGCWSAVGETARRRAKPGSAKRIAAALSLLGLTSLPAFALPTGENITAGKADIIRENDGKSMLVNQHTDKLITNWNDFNIAGNERVSFHQPGTTSIALNRVVGNNGSQIQGQLDANGKVFLVNPNGVLFGSGAQINVGGLVASTQNIADADFLAGNYHFSGNSTASIVNDGHITAADGGSVALLGARVSNNGVIQAKMGRIALSAGNAFKVNFDGNDLLSLQVEGGAVDAQANNGGLLKADGGEVLMTARAAGNLLDAVVNNTGKIEALGLSSRGGKITLDGSTVEVAGKLDASAAEAGAPIGSVTTRGERVDIANDTIVDTRAGNTAGKWTIEAANGGVNGTNVTGNSIDADTLSRNLGTTNVALTNTQPGLMAGGPELMVGGPVVWNSDNALTLTGTYVSLWHAMLATGTNASLTVNAYNLRVKDTVKLTGRNAHLELTTKYLGFMHDQAALMPSGENASFRWNGENYKLLHTVDDLRNIDANLGGRYALGNTIDGAGGEFRSIGRHSPFSGVLEGLGNTISGLRISNAGYNFVGLFAVNAGYIANLNLRNIITLASGQPYSSPVSVGTLAGYNLGTIEDVTAKEVTVTAKGRVIVGGLVGHNQGNIYGSTAAANVIADTGSIAGGLVGYNRGDIYQSASASDVIAGTNSVAGGLAGHNDKLGTIHNSRAEGNVTVADKSTAGGVVGVNEGSVQSMWVVATVTGKNESTLGGIAGRNTGSIGGGSSSFGNITGGIGSIIGGVAGENGGVIDMVRSGFDVLSGLGSKVGGLVGRNTGSIVHSTTHARSTLKAGAQSIAGGLVGENLGGTIDRSYAWGNVEGGDYSFVGGLVGYNGGTITNSMSEGVVSGGRYAMLGGLAGGNFGFISGSSTSGRVETVPGHGQISGPLVGLNVGQVED
ncbi:two-partner secretion domain-containing protein [Burkholderia sp. JKS000303]|uniref:two-partner secretion domain-containing protein n=1 Tax=Burkholderia sp. JKS000303 TaxID=1938747 RepID=UPI000BF8D12A|nr:filamentous hemagglutinin N-terminal domain-containing protein [Burkholderia sp. JKS000303]PFH19513.1 filamentous hemagglutinin family protein [Burkholderia sp. JKS000303]